MKRIILTCDTEVGELANALEDGFRIFVEGDIDGQKVGVSFINAIANQYGAKVTHFVDVYHPRFQKEIAQICEKIIEDGNCVGLHTHPFSRFGKRFMYEYSFSEQQNIIDFGQKFLNRLNIPPRIHRAGGYGANDDTLQILAEAGFKWDSSYFPHNPVCKISKYIENKIFNPVQKRSLLEVPVTVYQEEKKIFGIDVGRTVYKKLDFRYGTDVDTVLDVIDKSPKKSTIVLFFHSFNFLEFRYSQKTKRFTYIGVSSSLIKDYYRLLDRIRSNNNCVFSTFDSVEGPEHQFLVKKSKNMSITKKIKRIFMFDNYVEPF